MLLLASVGYLFLRGTGIWGLNIPVAWGFAIVNFVWWIGIGHAGTLISAILLLLRQQWRTSINRFAEAMTLFAVACAGLFPLIHMGRPQQFYYLMPYPSTTGPGPSFAARWCGTFLLSAPTPPFRSLFWYIGLIPDLGQPPGPCEAAIRPDRLRDSRHGLARVGTALDAVRAGLSAAGRARDTAGRLGAHDRQFRLRRRR